MAESTDASPIRVVAAGVDSLYLGYTFEASRGRIREIETAKLAAGRASKGAIDPRTGEPVEREASPVVLAGVPWSVRAYGSAAGPFLAHHEAFAQWALNPDAANGAPALQVKLYAAALWRDGAGALADRLAHELARDGFEKRYVQRIDIAVDFQGWVPEIGDFDRFCANGAPTREAYPTDPIEETLEAPRCWYRWNLTGFRFGKSSVVVRLYDKSVEIGVSGKTWFKLVWAKSPLYREGEPVWRLEVQCPRAWLKDVRDDGSIKLETVEEVLREASAIWRTVLERKIRLTTGDATRVARSSTHPAWKALTETIEIDGVCDGGHVTRIEQDKITAEELVPKVAGYMAKWASLKGIEDLDGAALALHGAVETHLADRGETFTRIVQKKSAARRTAQVANLEADVRGRTTKRAREREAAALRVKTCERRATHRRWAPVQLGFEWKAQTAFQWSKYA